ncbi:MAG: metal-dependent hydrolase [Anaerolineae bacterium]
MKGIAHFITGVAVATFFPEVVHGAAHNLGFGPLLGGFAGLLPDTLDFKFVRYFARLDDEIDPAKLATEAGHPDPQAIAERIAAAMNRAYNRGKLISVQLHTLKLGADLWRRYSLTFDLSRDQVVVRIGPVVTTGQVPYADSQIPDLAPGRAQVQAPILHTYDAETTIDIFDGPSLAFEKRGDAVEVTFLPWHRAWTHSLAMVVLLGIMGFLFAPVYALVMALAALAHILEDQLGFMGSNLLFPFTGRRTMGLKLVRSGDAIPNLMTVWVSLAAILLNLDRFSATPSIPVLPYVLTVMATPCLIFLGLSVWTNRRRAHRCAAGSPRAMAALEALDETEEVDI